VNDVWALGIFLVKTLAVPHPFIDFGKDTESTAKEKIIQREGDFHFRPEHIVAGGASSLVMLLLEPDIRQRITVRQVRFRADAADTGHTGPSISTYITPGSAPSNRSDI
jgi:hypothetical protein